LDENLKAAFFGSGFPEHGKRGEKMVYAPRGGYYFPDPPVGKSRAPSQTG
jgi:hypothetical protein